MPDLTFLTYTQSGDGRGTVVFLGHNGEAVVEIRQTDVYAQWFDGLREGQARARIDVRIRRLSLGNPGDV